MLRLVRPLRKTPRILYTRPSIRQSSKSSYTQVKFKKPWVRKFVATCLIYGAAFNIWTSFVLLRLDEQLPEVDAPEQNAIVEEDDAGSDAEADGQGTVEETPIFIPLSWPFMRQGKLYLKEDSEWQEFVKISRDSQKLKSLRDELAILVLKSINESDSAKSLLGTPIRVTQHWLEPYFPPRAPPVFEISGLEIRGGTVSWTTKLMEPQDGDRLKRSLRPTIVAHAIKDVYLALLEKQWSRIKGFLWFDNLPAVRKPEWMQVAHNVSADSTIKEGKREPQPASQIQTSDNLRRDSSPSSPLQSSIISSLQHLPLPELGPGSDVVEAASVLQRRLKASIHRQTRTSKRGTFFFTGPIGLRGPKRRVRLDVVGEYDPSTASWVRIKLIPPRMS